jgi:hypothetical protein
MEVISEPTKVQIFGLIAVVLLSQYNNAVFDQLRLKQDLLADQAVHVLVSNSHFVKEINSWESIPNFLPVNFPVELQRFFEFYLVKEKEFSLKEHKQAQAYFERNGDLYLAMLGFYSLPYCYAFADGAQVLVRSQRILDQIGERLGETTRFVLDIFKPGAFASQDAAYLTCAKVRLIHGYSRYFIREFAKDWNPSFGEPINQEDLLGTNLAFSHIVLRGMTKMGFPPSPKEHQEVLGYWKWIGELMGVETLLWPTTAKEAFELDRLIRRRQLKPSEAGKKLTRALLEYYQKNIPDPLLTAQLESLLAYFLGKEASRAIGIYSQVQIPGELMGLFLKGTGIKTFGTQKNHAALKKSLESQQVLQFGRILQLQLPMVNRS